MSLGNSSDQDWHGDRVLYQYRGHARRPAAAHAETAALRHGNQGRPRGEAPRRAAAARRPVPPPLMARGKVADDPRKRTRGRRAARW